MPIPRYIICSETRLIDKETGLATHCNVIDGFAFAVYRDGAKPESFKRLNDISSGRMIATAVWMRSPEDDKSQEYEFEYLLHKPGHDIPVNCASGTFRFSHTFHRIEQGFLMQGNADDFRSGVAIIENRIRPVGDEEWMSQQFPITIDVRIVTKDIDASVSSGEPS